MTSLNNRLHPFMKTKNVSNRVVNDIIQALKAIDNYQEAVESPKNGVVLRPKMFQFEGGTRLALAKNVGIFREYEGDLRRRHDELVVSMNPVEVEGRIQVPEERMKDFAKAWSLILDEVREITFHEIDAAGLHGGRNTMPLAMLGYLYHLAGEESLRSRFEGMANLVQVTRSEALVALLGLMTGLDGRPVATPSPEGQGAALIPWSYPANVRENLAYNLFVLHRSSAELNVLRTDLLGGIDLDSPGEEKTAELGELLEEKVGLPLIKIHSEELNLGTNAVPLAALDQIRILMAA